MSAVDLIFSFRVFSREGQCKPASKSEVRRWIEAGAVRVNGERLDVEPIDFDIFSLVLFPGGKRVTLK